MAVANSPNTVSNPTCQADQTPRTNIRPGGGAATAPPPSFKKASCLKFSCCRWSNGSNLRDSAPTSRFSRRTGCGVVSIRRKSAERGFSSKGTAHRIAKERV